MTWRGPGCQLAGTPSYASVGCADYSQGDTLSVWYKSVNFGAEKSMFAPAWSDQSDRKRARMSGGNYYYYEFSGALKKAILKPSGTFERFLTS